MSFTIFEVCIIGILGMIFGGNNVLMIVGLAFGLGRDGGDKVGMLSFLNMCCVCMFGVKSVVVGHLLMIGYYACFNYKRIIQYHDILIGLHEISKAAIDKKLVVEGGEFETLSEVVNWSKGVKSFLTGVWDKIGGVRVGIQKWFEGKGKNPIVRDLLYFRGKFNEVAEPLVGSLMYLVREATGEYFLKYSKCYKLATDSKELSSVENQIDKLEAIEPFNPEEMKGMMSKFNEMMASQIGGNFGMPKKVRVRKGKRFKK
ncbi:MAG: hypothetical protein Hyperionvirus25_3 [Hyperionvirus sp.]|uniref:Uncharacterized protein n=1 Tax=Hyperionvirus sp. TaxID=2487770 RepID=A0A3G5AB47_9VIRU|nr:MAG: hypothetical protein Hyperionvirus25_3 [Hyperionvirus sp.]